MIVFPKDGRSCPTAWGRRPGRPWLQSWQCLLGGRDVWERYPKRTYKKQNETHWARKRETPSACFDTRVSFRSPRKITLLHLLNFQNQEVIFQVAAISQLNSPILLDTAQEGLWPSVTLNNAEPSGAFSRYRCKPHGIAPHRRASPLYYTLPYPVGNSLLFSLSVIIGQKRSKHIWFEYHMWRFAQIAGDDRKIKGRTDWNTGCGESNSVLCIPEGFPSAKKYRRDSLYYLLYKPSVLQ